MGSKNDITGDSLRSKADNVAAFATGWDLIWGKKDTVLTSEESDAIINDQSEIGNT